ncbi:MAG TPA: F0F1 ATP synthase subunit epsilon [Rhodanobacteraceae bacterium]|nr:F0F1 ATP synthase subunit epsilon [Rhodanobacteraceae bacterium]
MQTIHCDIVSAEAEIFRGEVTMVIASGEDGELGIAPRHTPLVTRLKPGQVRVHDESGQEHFYYVSGGIIEVQPNVVTILADSALRAQEIDEGAALEAKKQAEIALGERGETVDIAAAQMRLAEAQAQLQALERLRKNLKH